MLLSNYLNFKKEVQSICSLRNLKLKIRYLNYKQAKAIKIYLNCLFRVPNFVYQFIAGFTISPIEALKNATGFVMTVAQQALKNKYQSNDLQGALPPNIQMQNILAHSNTDKDDANELVSQAQKSTNINSELRVQETRLYDDISIIPPSDSNYDKLESLKQTRDKLKYQIGVYQAMSEDQARDELINFLECADPLKFRKKMKGVQMPFSTHSKSPMALESKDPISIKIDIETKKTQNDQVRKQMQEIKMKKIQERLQTEREAQEKASQDREELAQKYKNINRQKLAQIAAQQITSKVNNMNQINTQKIKQQKKNPSYTFQDFEKMHYSELNRDTIQEEIQRMYIKLQGMEPK